jgi:spore germination protein KA/spore germination protein
MQLKRYEKILENLKQKNMGAIQRTLRFAGGEITLFYIKQLTDRDALSKLVIKPLMMHEKINITAEQAQNDIIYADECSLDNDEKKIEGYLLAGKTVILFSNDPTYIVANLRKVEKRDIPGPEINYVIRGPKDCFIEDLETNISLIRYRIKSDKLRLDFLEVGERTKTRVAVIYLADVANDTAVNEIKKRINDIHTDGFEESGELQAFLLNKKSNFFPQMGVVERSDMACGAIMEGKVVTLVEGSGLGLIAPKVLSEFIWTCDDFYENKYIGFFLRLLRVLSLIISLTVSALYVAIISFHNDTLPSDYVIALAQMRSRVPFNALVEVLLVELVVEILRDALLRVPTKMGPAMGIMGTIILGTAAIAAGIFSPLLLIVVSLSLICSFVPADYTMVNTFRLLKFLLIFASGTFGFYGFSLMLMLILSSLVSVNSFGVPYMAPFAPFIFKDFIKSFFYSKSMAPRRPYYLRTKDKMRGKK